MPSVPQSSLEDRLARLGNVPQGSLEDRLVRLRDFEERQLAKRIEALGPADRLRQGLVDRAKALGPVDERLKYEPYRRKAAIRNQQRLEAHPVVQERQAVRDAYAAGALQPANPKPSETLDEYVARMRPAFPRAVDPYVDTSFDTSYLATRLAALTNPGPSRAELRLQTAVERAREERAQREAT
jgi:hypothetical protein